jgi:hypothetical protein
MPDTVQFSLRWTGKAYPPIPEGDGICKLTFRSSEPRGGGMISLRMQDRNGEVFQFRPTGVLEKCGRHRLLLLEGRRRRLV